MMLLKAYLPKNKFWIESLLALSAGAAMPLAFAPFEIRFVSVISLFALILLLRRKTAKASLVLSFIFGVGLFGVGVSWVFNSLYYYGEAPAFLAGLITAGLIVILALFVALMGWAMNKWFRQPAWIQFILVFPALWVLQEWLRSWVLTGFPWLLVGYTQVDTVLSAYIPALGALGTSGVVAMASGCLATLIVADRRDKMIALFAILIMGIAAFGLGRYQWVQPAGDSLQVAVVQGNIAQEIKLKSEYLQYNLDRYVALSRDHYNSEIIIWPETAVPTFKYYAEPFFTELLQELNDHNVELLTGVFELDQQTGQYYNSLYKVGHDGPLYQKQHLVPFGEYMPLRGLLLFLRRFINIPMSDIAIGKPLPQPIEMQGIPIGMSICYESAYSDVFQRQLPQAQLLVNVSNDAWFGDSLAPHQHLEITRARALESGRYLLRATNTGISAIIDQDGNIKAKSARDKAQVLVAQVLPYTGSTFYILAGNYLCIMMALCPLVLLKLFAFYVGNNSNARDDS